MYRKLKRTWSHNDLDYIPNFQKIFPELSKVSSEELADRFALLKLNFYYEEKTPVSFWNRLTLPFAIFFIILMFLLLPISFLFTGKWGYSLREKNIILNWFRSLGLQ